jgi:hypothetical protein
MYNQSTVYVNVHSRILMYTQPNPLFYIYHYKHWHLMSMFYKQTFLT